MTCQAGTFEAALGGHDPSRIALVDPRGDVSYGELAARVSAVRHRLCPDGTGLDGRIVATPYHENSTEFVVQVLGVLAAGGTHLPFRTTKENLHRVVERCTDWDVLGSTPGARSLAAVCPGRWVREEPRESNGPAADPGPDGAPIPGAGATAGRILETSGTSGPPKWVYWTESDLYADRAEWVELLHLGPGDVVLSIHPLDVAHAIDVHVLPGLLAGSTVVLAAEGASPQDLLTLVAQHGVTMLSALPAHYDAMADACEGKAQVATVRTSLTGGAPLTTTTIENVEDRLGWGLRRLYGATECGIMCADFSQEPQLVAALEPLPGVEVRLQPLAELADASSPPRVGEALIRRPHRALRYWGDQTRTAATFRDSWYHTGDVLREVSPGRYEVLGRVDDVWLDAGGVVRSGLELAARVRDVDGVRECVVISPLASGHDQVDVFCLADPAFLTTRTETEVRVLLAPEGLSVRVWVAGSWPRTIVGKPERRALVAWSQAAVSF